MIALAGTFQSRTVCDTRHRLIPNVLAISRKRRTTLRKAKLAQQALVDFVLLFDSLTVGVFFNNPANGLPTDNLPEQ
jgi:hypothetical protein